MNIVIAEIIAKNFKVGDVSIAINAEIKKRESSKLSSREGSFSRAFPEHLIDKFNSLLAGVRA